MQNACEPVHIQLNLSNNKVMVLNRTYKPVSGLIAQVNLYTLDSKSISAENVNISLAPTEIKETSSLDKVLKESKGVTFVVLNLKNQSGKVISHNAYWISPDGDYKSMNEMPETNINVSVLKEEERKNDREWKFRITNNTGRIAFFIRPQLMSGGEEILPSFWSGSYFTLAPGESMDVAVNCPSAKLAGAEQVLKVSGWNVSVTEVALKKN
jgi:hypothetical protein